jgi:hypothetical protein
MAELKRQIKLKRRYKMEYGNGGRSTKGDLRRMGGVGADGRWKGKERREEMKVVVVLSVPLY